MSQRLYRRSEGGCWYVYLGRDSAGEKVARSTGCRDRRAAEARAVELERAFRSPATDAAPDPTPLADAIGRALTALALRKRAQGTLDMHRKKAGHLLRLFREWGIDDDIEKTDARIVDDYIAARLAEGAAPSTVQKELVTLRVTLANAKRRGEYARDLDAVMPQGFSPEYVPRTRALTPEELRTLLADLLDDRLEQRRRSMADRAARVAFIVATSARWGESDRARPEDVDLRTGVVHLRGTKTAASRRTVPILPVFAPLLAVALEHAAGSGVLFTPWLQVRADLHRACARLGIPPVSPNDLRRTHATWLRSAGVEPDLIGSMLGHRDGRMVALVYGKIAADALGALIRSRMGAVTPIKALPLAETKPRERRKEGKR